MRKKQKHLNKYQATNKRLNSEAAQPAHVGVMGLHGLFLELTVFHQTLVAKKPCRVEGYKFQPDLS